MFQKKNCQIGFTDIFDDKGKLNKDLGYMVYNELLKAEIKTD
jgi:hypothetical protein